MIPQQWIPTDEDRELLHRDYERTGIKPGTTDMRLAATVAAFLRTRAGEGNR